jgi:hypothetical protein
MEGEENTLCQHNLVKTPRSEGRKVEKFGEIFAYSLTTMRTLESFFSLLLSPQHTLTTHAQILLSLRYNIIPLYLNLATINLHKMVKRKIPLITSSAQHTRHNNTARNEKC